MNRKALVRGIQLIVAITLATFAYILYDGVHSQEADLALGLANLSVGWLAVAALCALQEGVCGGLRLWVLCRVIDPKVRPRTGIISEFVLMFCAGVTPGQAGAAPSQIAVLMNSGMRFADATTASLMTASCTTVFFLLTAVVVFTLRATGQMAVMGGPELDVLLGVSVATFGAGFVALFLSAAYPPLLHGIIRLLAPIIRPPFRALVSAVARIPRVGPWAERILSRPGVISAGLVRAVDDFHRKFRIYLRQGKLAYFAALLLTFGFFVSRFAVAYFLLKALGLSTTPDTFVTIGPPVVQVILVQALLNFALYLSPTPGASGIAEAGSAHLMAPWVRGAFELPYLLLWRILALFLCMFVGGLYVFRYLGTDVLEKKVKEVAAEKAAADAEPEPELPQG